VAENDHLPLTWHIALTTVYALTCYTVITVTQAVLSRLHCYLRILFSRPVFQRLL